VRLLAAGLCIGEIANHPPLLADGSGAPCLSDARQTAGGQLRRSGAGGGNAGSDAESGGVLPPK
jgi:hypothetical protein